MRFMKFVVLCLLPIAAGAALAQGNAEQGKALYASCVACHGAEGEGNSALKAPRLNHLQSVYIQAQLQKFKSGHRGGQGSSVSAMSMAPMATTLADEQAMADVAAYIVGLDGGPSAAAVEGDITLGGDYYNQFCGACHGAAAEGNLALNSPALAGTDDWYLSEQLRAFRAGERGAHPDDRTGKQMRAMSMVLPSDQAIADVVAFIRSLEP